MDLAQHIQMGVGLGLNRGETMSEDSQDNDPPKVHTISVLESQLSFSLLQCSNTHFGDFFQSSVEHSFKKVVANQGPCAALVVCLATPTSPLLKE